MAAANKWLDAFKQISAKTHTDQAKFWLNGFWEEGANKYAEDIWNYVSIMQEVETGQKKLYGKRKVDVQEGCDLDEHKAHVFLEKLGETLTVQALRKRLKEIDIDMNKRMSLVEYLLCKHRKTPLQLVNSPQGGASKKEIDDARAQVESAQNSVEQVSEALEESNIALAEAEATAKASAAALAAAKAAFESAQAAETKAKKDENAAKAAASAAAAAVDAMRAAETELKAAEESLRAAVAEVNAQEEAYKAKVASLEKISSDPDAGAVKKNKAINELAQLKSEDPLPLRRAKITQEAALKRAERARKPFADATAKAEAEREKAEQAAQAAEVARKDAEQKTAKAQAAQIKADQAKKAADAAKAAAEDKKRQLEQAVAEAERELALAQETLDALMAKGGDAMGDLFWMDREMKEMRKYLPGYKAN